MLTRLGMKSSKTWAEKRGGKFISVCPPIMWLVRYQAEGLIRLQIDLKIFQPVRTTFFDGIERFVWDQAGQQILRALMDNIDWHDD